MTSQYRRTELLRQYAMLRQPDCCPTGVYISPLPDIEEEWSGVLFIHKGLYAGSVLRFRIIFPAQYPSRAPDVYFETGAVIHPLVDPSTDRLALASGFPQWNARVDNVAKVLFFIKGAFKSFNMRQLRQGLVVNPEAWRFFTTQPQVFARLAAQCATVSSSSAALYRSPMAVKAGNLMDSRALETADSVSEKPFDFRAINDEAFEQMKANLLCQ